MHRFFVIEARRLLPLLFLLVLLVSLSIYDNFFREEPVVAPDELDTDAAISFVTADRGELSSPTSFEVIASMEEWTRLRKENSALPDYPFNPAYEYAVSATNSEIQSVQVYPQEDGTVQVQVRVAEDPFSYHLVTVERDKVGEQTRWLFLDEEDQIIRELSLSNGEEKEAPDSSDTGQPGAEAAGEGD